MIKTSQRMQHRNINNDGTNLAPPTKTNRKIILRPTLHSSHSPPSNNGCGTDIFVSPHPRHRSN